MWTGPVHRRPSVVEVKFDCCRSKLYAVVVHSRRWHSRATVHFSYSRYIPVSKNLGNYFHATTESIEAQKNRVARF